VSDVWKSVDFFLPDTLSRDEVNAELRTGVIRFANDGGEFVYQIRVDGVVDHPGGWYKWNASYLAGPPGVPTPAIQRR
jgi:hypothetical protein